MEELHYSVKIHQFIRFYAEILAFVFLGFIATLMTFSVFIYWKTFLILYLRKDEKFNRGIFYSYIEYKRNIKNISVFTLLTVIFNVIMFFLPYTEFSYFWGISIFFSGYFVYCIKHYYFNNQIFDLFDDFTYLISRVKHFYKGRDIKTKED